ncbi:MAG: hypothetical protein Kow00107_08540 [Planctomycetota bacterium]
MTTYESVPVVFRGSKKRKLVGVLRLPPGAKAGLVTVHGWGAGRMGPTNMLSDICSRFASEGFATLNFDLSGRGDSEGSAEEVTIDDMMADTKAAVEELKGRGISKVCLFGLCSGGNAALGAVALGAEVDSVVAVSTLPFVPIEITSAKAKKTASFARGYFLKLFRAETWRKLFSGRISFKGVWRTLFGHASKSSVRSERVLKDTKLQLPAMLKGFRGKLCHIYGSADPDSKPAGEWFEREYEAIGLKAEFLVLDRANHNFYSIEMRERIAALVRRLLDE